MKFIEKTVSLSLLITIILASAICLTNNNLHAGENREDIDYGLEASKLTVKEGLKLLYPNIPTAIYKNIIKTTPILMGDGNVLHWMMKDGSIWTRFEYKNNDSVIIGYSHQKD